MTHAIQSKFSFILKIDQAFVYYHLTHARMEDLFTIIIYLFNKRMARAVDNGSVMTICIIIYMLELGS